MSQMDPQQTSNEWQEGYSGYEGVGQEHPYLSSSAQKLNVDGDDQFASLLARKIKQELRSEVNSATALRARAGLAIASVIAIVMLFVLLILALSSNLALGGAIVVLVWGFIGACAVIIGVNAYFNYSPMNMRDGDQTRERRKK